MRTNDWCSDVCSSDLAMRHWWLIIRCSVNGCRIVIVPGVGDSAVYWVAYAHTVQSAEDRSQFGKGDIRDVIGPESSNDAKDGGALVPTLIFGITGSGSTAILLGGMILLGVEPGITMVNQNQIGSASCRERVGPNV